MRVSISWFCIQSCQHEHNFSWNDEQLFDNHFATGGAGFSQKLDGRHSETCLQATGLPLLTQFSKMTSATYCKMMIKSILLKSDILSSHIDQWGFFGLKIPCPSVTCNSHHWQWSVINYCSEVSFTRRFRWMRTLPPVNLMFSFFSCLVCFL